MDFETRIKLIMMHKTSADPRCLHPCYTRSKPKLKDIASYLLIRTFLDNPSLKTNPICRNFMLGTPL